MSAGQIIWLNGVSSVGKTTLSKALQERLDSPFLHLQLDTFLDMLPRKVMMNPQSILAAAPPLVRGFHETILTLVDGGASVIVDHLLQEPAWLAHSVSLFESTRVLFVGVHCALRDLRERERERGDRVPGQGESLLEAVHEDKVYDIEVDTSELEVEESVKRIVEALDELASPTAFERMLSKLEQTDAYEAFRNATFVRRLVAAVDPATYGAYVGRYEADDSPGQLIHVRREGDRLFVTGELGEAQVLPEGEDRFFLRGAEGTVVFHRGQGGAVGALTLNLGSDMRARKLGDEEQPRAREALVVPPEVLHRYEGRYELSEGFVLTVTLEDGHLMAQVTEQPKLEIFASSENIFRYGVVTLEFTAADEGLAESVTLKQAGNTLVWRRLP
jgi:chloramphenicol 3-O phosphotransferase